MQEPDTTTQASALLTLSLGRMSDTRAQIREIRALIQRAGELRAQAHDTGQQLAAVLKQIATLTARYTRETLGEQQVPPTHSAGVWRAGNDGSRTPASHK